VKNWNNTENAIALVISLPVTIFNYFLGFQVIDYLFPYAFNTNYFLALLLIMITLKFFFFIFNPQKKLTAILATNTFLTWILSLLFTGNHGVLSNGPDLGFYLYNPATTLEYLTLNALFLLMSVLGSMIGISIHPRSHKKSRKR